MTKTGLALRVEWRKAKDPIEADVEQMRTAGTKPYRSMRKVKTGVQLRSTEPVNRGNGDFAGRREKG